MEDERVINRLSLGFAFCLLACSTIQYNSLQGDRNCLVNAIGFQDAYNADARFNDYRWSRILGIFWSDDKKIGHACCVFQFHDRIMVYDKERGSWTLTRDLALKDQPLKLAELFAPNTGIKESYYFEDLDTLAN